MLNSILNEQTCSESVGIRFDEVWPHCWGIGFRKITAAVIVQVAMATASLCAMASSIEVNGKPLYFSRNYESGCVVIQKGTVPYSGEVEIPDLEAFKTEDFWPGWLQIADGVFAGNADIVRIKVAPYVSFELSDGMFEGCANLEEVTGGFNDYYIPRRCFYGCEKLNMDFAPMNIGEEAFYGCKSLQRIDLSNVSQIERSTFEHCESLTEVSIGTSCGWTWGGGNILRQRAFAYCRSLQVVTIGACIQQIESECFGGTPQLRSFTVLDDEYATYDESMGGLMINSAIFNLDELPEEWRHGIEGFEFNAPKWVEIWDEYNDADSRWEFHVTNGVCEITQGTPKHRMELYTFPTNVKGYAVYKLQSYGLNDMNTRTAIIKDISVVEDNVMRGWGRTDNVVFENVSHVGDVLGRIALSDGRVLHPYVKTLTFKNVGSFGRGDETWNCVGMPITDVSFIDSNFEIPANFFGYEEMVYSSSGNYVVWHYADSLKRVYHNGLPPKGILETHPKNIMVFQWEPEYHEEWLAALGLKDSTPMVNILDTHVKANDPTVVEVMFHAYTITPTGCARALAFKDGIRSFANVIKMDSIEGGGAVGDTLQLVKTKTVSWRFARDWDVETAHVGVEIFVREDDKVPDLSKMSDADLLSFLFWEFADDNPLLMLKDGNLYVGETLVVEGDAIVDRETAITVFAGKATGGKPIVSEMTKLIHLSTDPYVKSSGLVVDGKHGDFIDYGEEVTSLVCDWNHDGLFDVLVFTPSKGFVFTNVGHPGSPEFIKESADENTKIAPLYSVYRTMHEQSKHYTDELEGRVRLVANDVKHGVYIRGGGYEYGNIRTLFYSFDDQQFYSYYKTYEERGQTYHMSYSNHYWLNLNGEECEWDKYLSRDQIRPQSIVSICGGDIDGDGLTDIVLTTIDNEIWYYRMGSDGTMFRESKNWMGNTESLGSLLSVSLVDWDSDGRMDCLIGNAEGKLMLLMGCKAVQPKSVVARPGVDSVALAWNPSAKAGCRGYNVYRRTDGGAEDFIRVNEDLVVLPSYRDELQPGIYEYRISAVCRYYEPGNSEPVISESDLSDIVRVEVGKAVFHWGDASGFDGDEITVDLGVENSLALSGTGLMLSVGYDPAVMKPVIVKPSGLTEAIVFTESIDNGRWTITANGGEISAGSGTFVSLVFKAIGVAEGTGVELKEVSLRTIGGTLVPIVLPQSSVPVKILPYVEPEPIPAVIEMTDVAEATAGESFMIAVSASGEGVDAATLSYEYVYDATLLERNGDTFTAKDVATAVTTVIGLTNVSVRATDGKATKVVSVGSCAVAISPKEGGGTGGGEEEEEDIGEGFVVDENGEIVDWGKEPEEDEPASRWGFRNAYIDLGTAKGKVGDDVEVSVRLRRGLLPLLADSTVDVKRWAFTVKYDPRWLTPIGINAKIGEYVWSATNGVLTVIGQSGTVPLGRVYLTASWQHALSLKFRLNVQYAETFADLDFGAVQARSVEGKRIYTPSRTSGGVTISYTRPKNDPTVVTPYGHGDLNGDGRLTWGDQEIARNLMNGDGKVEWTDKQLSAGDYNNDKVLDGYDYMLLLQDFDSKGVINEN